MRVLTYNVHSCIGIDGRCSPERIAEVIREIDPDIACLQELDSGRVRTAAVNQADLIAKALTMKYHFNATISEASEEYGDAVLSKHPFTLVRAAHLPPVPWPIPRENRGAIWVAAEVEGKTWQIVTTHLGLGRGERRLQAAALLRDWIAPAAELSPTVFCGDLNSRPSSAVPAMFGAVLADACRLHAIKHPRTFSTRFPLVCLDYIFLSPGLRVKAVKRHDSPLARIASDHFPLIAEIE